MLRLFAGLLACLLVEALAATSASSVRAAEPAKSEALRCSFADKQGYYKFSSRKPAGKRPWSLDLRIDHGDRRVFFDGDGVTSEMPFYAVGDDIRFDVVLGNEKERFSLNTKTLRFEIFSETPRHRLRHLGTCRLM